MAGAALGQDILAEAAGDILIEEPFFFEILESVGVEDFGPFIAVIARRITAGEDMAEAAARIGAGDRRKQAGPFGRLLLKGRQIGDSRRVLGMPCEIEKRETEL